MNSVGPAGPLKKQTREMRAVEILNRFRKGRERALLTFKVKRKTYELMYSFVERTVNFNGIHLTPNKVARKMNKGRSISSNKNIFLDGKSLHERAQSMVMCIF